MKTAIILAIVATFVVAPVSASGLLVPEVELNTTTEYIVGFETLPEDRTQYLGFPVVDVNDAISFFLVRVDNPALFEVRAAADPNVQYVEVNTESIHATLTPNDTFYNGYQWGTKPATTNIEAAWDVTLGTTAVKVCVVDSGAYRTHGDFVGTAWAEWKDFVNGKTSAYDDNGHGTHVSGTIGARTNNGNGIAGVAQASMATAKALNSRGSGTLTAVANAITWCADVGSHVISASLGASSGSSTLLNAVRYAVNTKGSLFVAAAGNSGPCTNCVDYPGKYAESYTVAATDPDNTQASYSSEGPEVDIAAPGTDIPSTYPAGIRPCGRSDTNCFVLSSGTSMATPHVSGLAALVKAANPSLTMSQVASRISSTARDLGPAGHDTDFGAGLIQGAAV